MRSRFYAADAVRLHTEVHSIYIRQSSVLVPYHFRIGRAGILQRHDSHVGLDRLVTGICHRLMSMTSKRLPA